MFPVVWIIYLALVITTGAADLVVMVVFNIIYGSCAALTGIYCVNGLVIFNIALHSTRFIKRISHPLCRVSPEVEQKPDIFLRVFLSCLFFVMVSLAIAGICVNPSVDQCSSFMLGAILLSGGSFIIVMYMLTYITCNYAII
jgi:hypothetical protein